MFLHVGADFVVSLKRIITILDTRSCQRAEATRDFLKRTAQTRRVIDIAEGDSKSIVVTDAEIYLSPISSSTLKRRADLLSSNMAFELDL